MIILWKPYRSKAPPVVLTKHSMDEVTTVNREYFKYFRTAWFVRKLNARNTCAILTTMLTGSFVRKLFNAKNYRMKYFRHEIFVIYGISLTRAL